MHLLVAHLSFLSCPISILATSESLRFSSALLYGLAAPSLCFLYSLALLVTVIIAFLNAGIANLLQKCNWAILITDFVSQFRCTQRGVLQVCSSPLSPGLPKQESPKPAQEITEQDDKTMHTWHEVMPDTQESLTSCSTALSVTGMSDDDSSIVAHSVAMNPRKPGYLSGCYAHSFLCSDRLFHLMCSHCSPQLPLTACPATNFESPVEACSHATAMCSGEVDKREYRLDPRGWRG